MNSYQPQQPQQQYRPNRTALWANDRKTAANHPDYKGNIEISYQLFCELQQAFNSGQYQQDRGGQPCIKLDLGLYLQPPGVSSSGRQKPCLSGQLSTVAETAQSQAARAAAAQQYQQQQAPQGYPPQQPQQPQYAQPAPVQQPFPPAQQPAPAQPAPAQPAPAQQQQAPGGWPAQVPAPTGYAMPQQPPQQQAPAPTAPPMPVQPMPGAIHGQAPLGSPGTPALPSGF
jgi:hypothetical protein